MFGAKAGWRYLRIGPSIRRRIAGSTSTTVATPRTTPLAITRPRSRPSVKRMKQSARKPAMVVRELPERDLKAATMETAMASRRSS